MTEVTTPCKLWTGTILSTGYGQVYLGYKDGRSIRMLAHRWVWEQANGAIPTGKVVMHKCDNPPCVEVTHLKLGTQKENFQDSITKGRNHYRSKTHCPKGHPYDAENTYMRPDRPGQRECRSCHKERAALRSQRNTTK